MKYKHFCHVDPQEPNITLVTFYYTKSASVRVVDT